MTNHVVTRFAPSPTGLFHAGSYRTALFAYFFARQNKGKFILRIEDTDLERSKKEYEQNIIESLKWLGLDYDEFYRQSERTDIYKVYIKKLIDSGKAYISKETPKEEGDRTEVIRFKNPNRKVAFDDLIRGHIEFDTTELGDFVIAKSVDEPVFHLVNVIDDSEMGITHVIRGEDHISNTPRQILIYEAIGATLPKFAHIPLLLSTDRSKLSKRHGALAMTEYRDRGYLPEALVNYMALLGWHPADEREIFSLEEIIREFSLERVQKSGAIFDEEKLKWFNRHYISHLSDQDFIQIADKFMPDWLKSSEMDAAGNPSRLKKLLPLLREKISVFNELVSMFSKDGELAFVKELSSFDSKMLLWKKNPSAENARKHLQKAVVVLGEIGEADFNAEKIKSALWPYAEENGRGDVLWPLRMALTGQEKSPDPFTVAAVLDKEESLRRIGEAILKL
jgi:glutamyl-tRNA synthetase